MTDTSDRTSAPPAVPSDARALRRLVDELRAEEPPGIAWDALEARLLARIDAAPPLGEPSPVDTSGVVELPARAEGEAAERVTERAPPRSPDRRMGVEGAHAHVVVPWDDDPGDDEAWKALRRPPPCDEDVAPSRPVDDAAAIAVRTHGASRRPSRWIAALAAVAAVLGGAVAALAPGDGETPSAPVDLAAVAREPRLDGALDLASLRAGDVVEAAEGPVRFGRDGFASWTLGAGGRLRVVSGIGHEEPRHVVALEAGALDVEVVPATGPSPPDRFVVEVGDARVAVHGTAFRVVRSTQGLVVAVTRGVVAVGPRSGAPGTGQLLEAPQRAAFALDGRGYRPLPLRSADAPAVDERGASAAAPVVADAAPPPVEPPAPVEPPPSSEAPASDVAEPEGVHGPSPSASPAASAGARGAAPREPAASLVELVRGEVAACIARKGAGTSEARVTLASRLVIDVGPTGAPRQVRFEPPIRPDLQACAEPVFRRRIDARGPIVVPLEVVLEPRAVPDRSAP